MDDGRQSSSIFLGAVPLGEIKLTAEHAPWASAYVADQFDLHQHPPVIAVFMSNPVLKLVKWSGVSKVRMQALRHSFAVLGMQTDFHFAKIICEFLVLIPKLAFVSRRKVNCTGYQIAVKETHIGRLDRRFLARIVFLKILLECDACRRAGRDPPLRVSGPESPRRCRPTSVLDRLGF